MTCPSWVALHSMSYTFIELCKSLHHDNTVIYEGWTEEALQTVAEKREAKGKGERGRYTQLNAEFQRTASRDKKSFLNEQYKETEENNKRRKTRDLFKKKRDCKGTFHARVSKIKDRNGKDLTEAEEI